MSITVSTTVDLTMDTEAQQVCSFAAVDVRQGVPPRDDINGFVSIGSPGTYKPLTLKGTADELRHFAKVVEDAAMEMERLHADAHAEFFEASEEQARALTHYSALAEEARADKAANDLDIDDWAVQS